MQRKEKKIVAPDYTIFGWKLQAAGVAMLMLELAII